MMEEQVRLALVVREMMRNVYAIIVCAYMRMRSHVMCTCVI